MYDAYVMQILVFANSAARINTPFFSTCDQKDVMTDINVSLQRNTYNEAYGVDYTLK